MDSVIVDWVDLRERRAELMFKGGLAPEEIKEDTYNVPSQSSTDPTPLYKKDRQSGNVHVPTMNTERLHASIL